MDKFKEGEDSFCTKEGRAQNRIPNELSEIVVQNGTVINAKMLNAWTEELVNLIEALGIIPDSTKNNQIATGLNNATVYNKVGTVNSWLCSKEKIPKTEAVLDGGTLRPEDYEDGLAELKKRCPSWISGENIQLPNYSGYFPRFDSSRTLGGTQGDAMRKIDFKLTPKLINPDTKSVDVTIAGRVESVVYKTLDPVVHHGARKIHLLQRGDLKADGHTIDLVQEYASVISIGDNSGLDINANITQEGNSDAGENRPINFGVIMTVVVGIPKVVEVVNG